VGLANLCSESETCVGSRVRLVGVCIFFEKNFYRLPFTPPSLVRCIGPSIDKQGSHNLSTSIANKIERDIQASEIAMNKMRHFSQNFPLMSIGPTHGQNEHKQPLTHNSMQGHKFSSQGHHKHLQDISCHFKATEPCVHF
jgi:hypothetical protein